MLTVRSKGETCTALVLLSNRSNRLLCVSVGNRSDPVFALVLLAHDVLHRVEIGRKNREWWRQDSIADLFLLFSRSLYVNSMMRSASKAMMVQSVIPVSATGNHLEPHLSLLRSQLDLNRYIRRPIRLIMPAEPKQTERSLEMRSRLENPSRDGNSENRMSEPTQRT